MYFCVAYVEENRERAAISCCYTTAVDMNNNRWICCQLSQQVSIVQWYSIRSIAKLLISCGFNSWPSQTFFFVFVANFFLTHFQSHKTIDLFNSIIIIKKYINKEYFTGNTKFRTHCIANALKMKSTMLKTILLIFIYFSPMLLNRVI